MALTAILSAALLAVAPLLPFLARPVGAALLGPLAPGSLLKSWQKVVTGDPVRLITGHGFETALRGRLVGLLPLNAPTTALFEFWYELGIVGALAAAFALYASIRRAGRDGPALVPGAMAVLRRRLHGGVPRRGHDGDLVAHDPGHRDLVFVAVERGQFRTSRPKVASCDRLQTGGLTPQVGRGASMPAMSASDSPTWWPISWISTWATRWPRVSSCSAQ